MNIRWRFALTGIIAGGVCGFSLGSFVSYIWPIDPLYSIVIWLGGASLLCTAVAAALFPGEKSKD